MVGLGLVLRAEVLVDVEVEVEVEVVAGDFFDICVGGGVWICLYGCTEAV